ncbi:hypothetical protein EVAR_80389_1 [Eumeta japonica]|uniref:Uncharacterized protein n=1 Tax=Eumeta variegata TaxID=151549 RepID=A0A4C1VG36_EUMVA|nr:hypothetical protein EVAR_80389_1 [Eumeta japonica]
MEVVLGAVAPTTTALSKFQNEVAAADSLRSRALSPNDMLRHSDQIAYETRVTNTYLIDTSALSTSPLSLCNQLNTSTCMKTYMEICPKLHMNITSACVRATAAAGPRRAGKVIFQRAAFQFMKVAESAGLLPHAMRSHTNAVTQCAVRAHLLQIGGSFAYAGRAVG